jgi:tetratricopeptide (TPR) repeat protein
LLLMRTHRAELARDQASESVAVFERLVRDHPNLAELRYDLALAHCGLGMAETALGRISEAERDLNLSLAMRQALINRSPGSHRYRVGLALTFNALARLLSESGRVEESLAACRKALSIHADNPILLNDLAWYLATNPASGPSQVAESVRLSRRAVQLAPELRGLWNTLGAAEYRAGDWAAATAALEHSMSLSGGGDGYDWLLLAMIAMRQGQSDVAMRWYDRAEAWIQSHNPSDTALYALRSEAASVLDQPLLALPDAGILRPLGPAATSPAPAIPISTASRPS